MEGGRGRAGGWGWPGGETPLRSQSWGPEGPPGSGVESRCWKVGARPLISPSGEKLGLRGRSGVVRAARPSMPLALFWVSACPAPAAPPFSSLFQLPPVAVANCISPKPRINPQA
ncbi:hypothetical protein Cadr_000018743 [Camelus dromedarius]|uniref:Uncharacterized protein n=1 Tax=Camelus dromedarius TaxID=9838 RepID=A0A5N4D5R4_CAMDR|nr:hypothetical protein Cadr_000018743 [Camelus dromedarius]KAB1266515.1 hypothetical protein Cadr_000018743 [Camelus dromedarius]KAB1266516.1 hypothetical protein Cadr_000018743 [Camelus dromedarius]KAB1266517.1 hypothetical protein Cadr_000018743 [Camelus dromedarius]